MGRDRDMGPARPVALVVALATAAAVSAAGLAPPAPAKPRPNLVVAAAHAHGQKYTFSGSDATLSFQAVTKNKGDATARHSQTVLYAAPLFAGKHAHRREVAARSVPKLRPGATDKGTTSATTDPDKFPPGAYDLIACADARNVAHESNERNCLATGKRFYVVPESWKGDLHGSGGAAGIADLENWKSLSADLVMDKYLGDGVFRYTFQGDVQWIDDGINPSGCTWSGAGELNTDAAGPGILLGYGHGNYQGTIEHEPFYPITISGPPGFGFCDGTTDGPVISEFLMIPRRHLRFDQHGLHGQFDEGGAEGTGWLWDFAGQ
jgi:hypothetical protein